MPRLMTKSGFIVVFGENYDCDKHNLEVYQFGDDEEHERTVLAPKKNLPPLKKQKTKNGPKDYHCEQR